MPGKVQLEVLREVARRAFGKDVLVFERPRTPVGSVVLRPTVGVRVNAHETIFFEGNSIQKARRLALRALEPLAERAE